VSHGLMEVRKVAQVCTSLVVSSSLNRYDILKRMFFNLFIFKYVEIIFFIF
jgi:hypothetical protein